MPRLTAQKWQTLDCIYTKAGFTFDRQEGSHRLYIKAGCTRSLTLPTYKAVHQDIILANNRTAGISREEYFRLLGEC